jgi:hypothetical protein
MPRSLQLGTKYRYNLKQGEKEGGKEAEARRLEDRVGWQQV